MNKKILNSTIFSLIFLFFTTINAECGSFRIQENYFADNLIGFYINSIDVNTGDSSIEYFFSMTSFNTNSSSLSNGRP